MAAIQTYRDDDREEDPDVLWTMIRQRDIRIREYEQDLKIVKEFAKLIQYMNEEQ